MRGRRDVALLLGDPGHREERRGHRSVHVTHADRPQLLADLQCPIEERARRVEVPACPLSVPAALEYITQAAAGDQLAGPVPSLRSGLVSIPQRSDGLGLVA